VLHGHQAADRIVVVLPLADLASGRAVLDSQALAALFTVREHVFFGLLEVGVDAVPLMVLHGRQQATDSADLPSFASPRHHKNPGHNQGILEAGPAVQAAVLQRVIIAFPEFSSLAAELRARPPGIESKGLLAWDTSKAEIFESRWELATSLSRAEHRAGSAGVKKGIL